MVVDGGYAARVKAGVGGPCGKTKRCVCICRILEESEMDDSLISI